VSLNGKVNIDVTSPPNVSLPAGVAASAVIGIGSLEGQAGPIPAPNWVELEYLYADGTGVAGASYTVYDDSDNVIAEGVLDKQGKAYVILPADKEDIRVDYGGDPADVEQLVTSEPQPHPEEQGWFDRMTMTLKGAWDTAKDAADWTWGSLQGDFNEDATIGQIATNAIITAIPVVDQVGDVRDITANIKLLVWDKRYKEAAIWFALVVTLVGLIPTFGSLLKGVFKAIWKGAKLDEVLALFNYFMKGNGVRWLKELKAGKLMDYIDEAAQYGHTIMDKVADLLTDLKSHVPQRFQNIHTKIQDTLTSLQTVKGQINAQFTKVGDELGLKIGKLLDEGVENSVRGSSRKVLVKQQDKAAPVDDYLVTKNAELNKHVNDSPVDVECGHPVNAITGAVVEEVTDFALPGRISLVWTRHYCSQTQSDSSLGYGWQSPADARLVYEKDGSFVYHHGSKSASVFKAFPDGDQAESGDVSGNFVLHQTESHYVVTGENSVSFSFPKMVKGEASYLEKVSDQYGNTFVYGRDDNGLATIKDSSGLQIEVSSENGHIRKMERVLSNNQKITLVEYGYDPTRGDLLSVTDQSGHALRYKYDNHCLTRLTFRSGLTFHYAYDQATAKGKAIATWGDNNLYHYRFNYRPESRRTEIINSLGHTKIFEYDESYKPVVITDHAGNISTYNYNAQGLATGIKDELGRQTNYQYNETGKLTNIERPDGSTIQLDFDKFNNPTGLTDPNGNLWQQLFDDKNRLVQKTTPTGAQTGYEYNTLGDLVAVTAPNGGKTHLNYNNSGQLLKSIHADGTTQSYEYDTQGRLAAAFGLESAKTTYHYDSASRLIRVDKPEGSSVHCSYDAESRLISYTNEKGQTIRLSYFGLGKLHKRINPDGTSLTYRYDSEENLIALINEKGEEYLLERDHAGRVTKETDYFGQSRHYHYDPAGQLLESIDPLKRVTRYLNDDLGRLIEKSFGDDSIETYSYDANGNLTGHSNESAVVSQKFDAENRLISETINGEMTSHEYDLLGNRTRRISARGNEIEYSYDDLGRNTAIIINGSELAITRNQQGLPIKETFGGIERVFDYTAQNQLADQLVNLPGGEKIQRSYEYDELGNLTVRKDNHKGESYFTYDPLGRITQAINPLQQVESFLHDPAGNLLKKAQTESATSTRVMAYDEREHHYDVAGNLIARITESGKQTFSWDQNNRLISVVGDKDQTVRMTYDAQGRRLNKQSEYSTTSFSWDGDQLLADNIDGKTREFVYYPGSFKPLAIIEDNGSINLIHTDSVGLPHEVTNKDGKIIWSATYDAQGNCTQIDSEKFANPLRFQGQYYDEEFDLAYNRYRYFDTRTSSFISQDPLGLVAGSNTYAYAPNVWGWIDPLGLSCNEEKANKGTATIHWYDNRSPENAFGHYSIETNTNGNIVHTHQLGAPGGPTMISSDLSMLSTSTKTTTIELPDPTAAQRFQLEYLDKLGPAYDTKTRSCVTHVGEVLRQGGVKVSAEPGKQFRFIKKLGL